MKTNEVKIKLLVTSKDDVMQFIKNRLQFNYDENSNYCSIFRHNHKRIDFDCRGENIAHNSSIIDTFKDLWGDKLLYACITTHKGAACLHYSVYAGVYDEIESLHKEVSGYGTCDIIYEILTISGIVKIT